MKRKLILALLLGLLLASCQDESQEFEIVQSTYWGCWREAFGQPGFYDLKLVGQDLTFYEAQLVPECAEITPVASLNMGFFRNDTLLLYNGKSEYWCYLKQDTLFYSTTPKGKVERFIKI